MQQSNTQTCLSISLTILLTLGGCDGKDRAPSDSSDVQWLSPTDQLKRISMALRGIRPSLEEIETVRNNPEALEGIVDTYLLSDEFGATIKDMHAELYLVRADTENQLPVLGILADRGYDVGDVHSSTVEAPLNFVRDIVMEDRPYREIMTAQYTLANQVVADIYGLAYDPAGPEWQPTLWEDGRPLAGILSDSEIWRRHTSNISNFNRARANFISNTFLCENIGNRDIIVDASVDQSDPVAINTNTSCISCHAVLDPMASFLWGYKEAVGGVFVSRSIEAGCEGTHFPGDPLRGSYEVAHFCYPIKFYNAVDTEQWKRFNLPPPGYFGVQTSNMTDLGQLIAEDPRFAQCTARSFFSYLGQVERDTLPHTLAAELQEILVNNNFSARQLAKAVVMSESFRALRPQKDGVFVTGLQTIRPEQYGRTVEDLTGFRWWANLDVSDCSPETSPCWGDIDLSDSDLYGYRAMSGGVDGLTTTRATHTASPTKALTMARLAEEAAGYVVPMDFAEGTPAARHLLKQVEADTVDEGTLRTQIAELHLRVLGEIVSSDGPEVDATLAVWSTLRERSGPVEAWKGVIAAMLQDVRMVFY